MQCNKHQSTQLMTCLTKSKITMLKIQSQKSYNKKLFRLISLFVFIIALVVLFTILYFINPSTIRHGPSSKILETLEKPLLYSVPTSLSKLIALSDDKKSMVRCVPETTKEESPLSMSTFYQLTNYWNRKFVGCRKSLLAFHRIYVVTQTHGEIAIDTEEFRQKVLGWLGNNQELFKQALSQNVTTIYNQYTHEETLFNPLRAKRPISKPLVSDLDYIEDLVQKTKDECDFCKYETYTAHDVSGRLVSPLAVAAANTFRYDRMHQLILSLTHHPLNWSREEFMAMFDLAERWFELAHNRDKAFKYPIIMWDVLPHGGASQVHPHLQLVLKPYRYPGNAENWRLAAQQYYQIHKKNYFADLISIYKALGLAVTYKSAVAIATLTPKKDNEIVIVCETASKDFYTLLYYVIRAYVDDLKVYPFSMAAALPVMHQPADSMPAFVRIVTRGKASEVRSDISSLELFAFNNVVSDPFELIGEIRASIDKRDN